MKQQKRPLREKLPLQRTRQNKHEPKSTGRTERLQGGCFGAPFFAGLGEAVRSVLMKRILLWLMGVALGVCVLLGAVMAVS